MVVFYSRRLRAELAQGFLRASPGRKIGWAEASSLLLDAVNRAFIAIQRWKQGIPRGSAQLYDKLASRVISGLHEHVAEEAARLRPNRVLDVGCGPGSLLASLARLCDAHTLVGVDISRAMARIFRRNSLRRGLWHRMGVIVADSHALPFRDRAFDLILSTGTLHHLRRPSAVFSECARVLRVGEAWIYELSHDVPPSRGIRDR